METSTRDYEAGEVFRDARPGKTDMVVITSVGPGACCFQLRWSHMEDFSPWPFVTRERLIEIIGDADPITKGDLPSSEGFGPDDLDEDLGPVNPADIIPAETVAAHVHPKADGSVEILYFAWADVWGPRHGGQARALQNEVKGRHLFDETALRIAPAAARLIASELYPYRLSPETRISTSLFPVKRSLMDRLRLKIFGGPAFIEKDALTAAIEAELQNLAEAAPSSSEMPGPR